MKMFKILFLTVAVKGGLWDAVSDLGNHLAHLFKPKVSGFSTAENYLALEKADAHNLDLKLWSGDGPPIEVEWIQQSRCWWKCHAKFHEWQYVPAGQYASGQDADREYMVFVAEDVDVPRSFNTLGYQDMLNFGIFSFENYGANAIAFVIMPSDWQIYQDRFKTSALDKMVGNVANGILPNGAAKLAAGAAAGAAIGSFIPVAGTAVGILAGATAGFAFAEVQDDYVGHFLRHLG
jgi:hypothetical protein